MHQLWVWQWSLSIPNTNLILALFPMYSNLKFRILHWQLTWIYLHCSWLLFHPKGSFAISIFLFLKLFFSAWIKLQNIWISTPVESQLVAGSWVVHRRKRTRVPTWINLHCRCLRCRCLRCLRCRYAHKGSHLNQQVLLRLKPFHEIKDGAHSDCLKIETNKSLHNCTK